MFDICSVCRLHRLCSVLMLAPAVNSSPLFAALPHNPPCQSGQCSQVFCQKNTNNELHRRSCLNIYFFNNGGSRTKQSAYYQVDRLTSGQLEVDTEEANMDCSEAFQLSERDDNNRSNRSVANAMPKSMLRGKRSMKARVGD